VSAGKLLLHQQAPKGSSARHPPPTFLFLPYSIVKEPKPESFKTKPPKPPTQTTDPGPLRAKPASKPYQVMATTKGAGQLPAPPSLWELYTHHPRRPSSAIPKKNRTTRKFNQNTHNTLCKNNPDKPKTQTKTNQ
jgi:hypothetical protein